jgi:hypothetical protein
MANEMTLFKGAMPSFMKTVGIDETTKKLLGSGTGGKRISIKGGVFRMIANGEEVAVNEDRAMNVIVVEASDHVARTFYEGQYKEGEITSPACWSADGKTPSDTSAKPQFSNCAQCPQNIKGSGQGESKACRYSRKLAVVLDGDVDGDVYSLTLAATSMFGKADGDKLPFDAYVRYLASHNAPVTAVVTEMRFDIKSPVPKLFFSPVRVLTDDEWESCREKAATPEAKAAVTVSFSGESSAPFETPSQLKAIPKPAAKPVAKPKAEEPEVAEAEEAPAPTKAVKKAKPAAPAEADDLADLIDEWAN